MGPSGAAGGSAGGSSCPNPAACRDVNIRLHSRRAAAASVRGALAFWGSAVLEEQRSRAKGEVPEGDFFLKGAPLHCDLR